MKSVILASPTHAWHVSGLSGDAGSISDVTVTLTTGSEQPTGGIRTIARPGYRLDASGAVHGVVLTWEETAVTALLSLQADVSALTDSIDAADHFEQRRARASKLAADRSAWTVVPLDLDGDVYALWTFESGDGVAAHADLGWAVVAMWTTGPLPSGEFRFAELDDQEIASASDR